MKDQNWIVDCPNCGRRVEYRLRAQNPFFPFCSERCKLIDLGKWLDEEHRISEPLKERQNSDGHSEDGTADPA